MDPIVVSSFTTVNALGRGKAATLAALRAERGGLQPCDLPGLSLDSFIGRIDGLEQDQVRPDLAAYDCRNNRLAQAALETDGFAQAAARAIERYGAERLGLVMGTSTSGVAAAEEAYRRRDEAGALPAAFVYAKTHDLWSLTDYVRRALGLGGPALTVSTACSTSAKVFADGWQLIQAGLADAVVVGGVDSLCRLSLSGFNSLELLGPEPCRPFDADRKGISIGEAGGYALLERRPARPGEILLLGYGESCDAYHMSSPHPEGLGAELAMRAALGRAGLRAHDIDYINLHGTGSQVNDKVENLAVGRLFGDRVPCSSTKGWTGHTLGAAGITEAAICCLALTEGFVPANLNLRRIDPDMAIRIATRGEDRPLRRVLTNSFGFGGNNCSLILGIADSEGGAA